MGSELFSSYIRKGLRTLKEAESPKLLTAFLLCLLGGGSSVPHRRNKTISLAPTLHRSCLYSLTQVDPFLLFCLLPASTEAPCCWWNVFETSIQSFALTALTELSRPGILSLQVIPCPAPSPPLGFCWLECPLLWSLYFKWQCLLNTMYCPLLFFFFSPWHVSYLMWILLFCVFCAQWGPAPCVLRFPLCVVPTSESELARTPFHPWNVEEMVQGQFQT